MEVRIVEEYEGIKEGDDVLVRKSLGVWERGTFRACITADEPTVRCGDGYHKVFLISKGGAYDECKPLIGNWHLEGSNANSTVDIWTPKRGFDYYRVDFSPSEGQYKPYESKWQSDKIDWGYYIAGLAFRDIKKAKWACRVLNTTLKQIKTMMTEIDSLPF